MSMFIMLDFTSHTAKSTWNYGTERIEENSKQHEILQMESHPPLTMHFQFQEIKTTTVRNITCSQNERPNPVISCLPLLFPSEVASIAGTDDAMDAPEVSGSAQLGSAGSG